MKKTVDGKLLSIMILENQEKRDYSLPMRVNLEEAITYDRQVKEIRSRNKELLSMLKKKGKEFNAGEFLYLFRKTDRVRPVITMVLYWNNEAWDGANSLDELIDFSGAEEMRAFVPKHPLRIVDMARLQNTECFKTDLRSVVEYFKRRNDKEAFREYYENCETACELDQEGMEVVGALVNSEELLTMLKNKPKEGDGKKMCRAITELIEEGKQEERKNTEREKERADQAEQRADQAEQRADLEKQRADQAEKRACLAERELEKIRKLYNC